MAYGITDQGFVLKPLADIKSDLEAAFKAAFGAGINVQPQSRFGLIIGIMAERLSDLWQGLEAVHGSQYPDSAAGDDLDNLASLTGTLRHQPTYSVASKVVLVGTAGTVVPAGSVAEVTGVGTLFDSNADATIAALTAWASGVTHAVDDLVTNAGNVYRCAQAGTTASAPTGTGTAITDGTCVWEYVGAGTAAVQVDFTAESTGVLPANAGTLTTIATPVAGWASVYNPTDATVGTDLETDSALRVRRESELRGQGNSAVDAMRAKLLRVAGVTAASVFDNPTDATDANGLPPHSIECVVQGGADQDIRDTILAAKAAGIATHGNVTGTALDGQSISHEVDFSRLVAVNVWVTVNVTKLSTGFPSDGAAQIQAALVEWAAANLLGGTHVVASKLYAPIFDGVSGIDDVSAIYIGTASGPTGSATVPITIRQIASLDTSRIVVNVS